YQDILRELLRLGRPEGWRAVLLTSDLEALKAAVAATPGARVVGETPVRIRGEAATITVLRGPEAA
ncbi:MAG: hypothetical protein ACREEV_12690, partial [Dongiaceae bacterium]